MIPLLVLFVGLASAVPFVDKTPGATQKCGYDTCTDHDLGMLNVHIVPHTHDDVGWLKTVDQYYFGSRNDIQKAGVQYILDSVIQALWENPKRRFFYVETYFFYKWWLRQDEDVQRKTRELISSGRLKMAGGAASMNDEAAVHYHSTIDQFTWGLRILNDTFGECAMPQVGWQIDPFGHSREFASQLASMGFDGLFFGRIDYQDKINRIDKKTMEMLWRGDDDLGKSSDLFTGVLYNHYSPPPGFCFDILCQDEPIIDDVNSPMYNVEKRVSDFLRYINTQKKSYRSNNVMLTMGGDFTYQDAGMYFKNLDKLIEYTNLKAAKEGLDVKLFYSTPDCYLKAVKDANPTLPTKQDDFFPYASDPTAYWTGYFSSRPTTKYFERQGNSYLQMAKQLQVIADLEEHNNFILNELKEAMGIMQHHDAITGTEKEHVTHDYERILDQAIEDSLLVTRQAFTKFVEGDATSAPSFTYSRCRFNESSCHTSETSDLFVVTVYNPLAWHVNESVWIPVRNNAYEVFSPNGEKIVSQLADIPRYVLDIPTRTSKATHELVFIAHLRPLSYKTFYIRKIHDIQKRNTKAYLINCDDKYDTDCLLRKHGILQNDEFDPGVLQNDGFGQDVLQNGYFENGGGYLKRTQGDCDKNKKDLYETDLLNDYFDNIKRHSYVDIKNIEDVNINVDSKIPEEPINVGGYVRKGEDADLNVLKDVNRGGNYDVRQLEDIIRESRRLIQDAQRSMNSQRKVPLFPTLDKDEMRMLSDEPTVMVYPEDIVLENQHLKLLANGSTGKITLVSLKNGITLEKFDIKYAYYPGCYGNNYSYQNRSSGAYIFRPNATKTFNIEPSIAKGPTGPVFREIRIKTDKNVAGAVRIYDGLNYLEHDWTVGPINIEDGIGKEYVIKYITDIVNNGEFYTDSNGRQMLKRKLFSRPQWNVTLDEPVAGNYYPVTNKIYIEDDRGKVVVLTDRSEGGSSLQEGQIELMIHRRLLHDDAFGVGEALNETANGKGLVVRGTHRIYFPNEAHKNAKVDEKKKVIEFHLRPQVFVSKTDLSLDDWLKLKNCNSFANELPLGVHLLTLEPWNKNQVLLRLENYLENSDKKDAIEVDLKAIFKTLSLKSFKEMTLAANKLLKDVKKWSWKTESKFVESFNKDYGSFEHVIARDDFAKANDEAFKIKLKAKEIRTFIVDYEMK